MAMILVLGVAAALGLAMGMGWWTVAGVFLYWVLLQVALNK